MDGGPADGQSRLLNRVHAIKKTRQSSSGQISNQALIDILQFDRQIGQNIHHLSHHVEMNLKKKCYPW